jgi:hypothetical protein
VSGTQSVATPSFDLAEQIWTICSPRFIAYPAATEALDLMESLLIRPRNSRPRNLLVAAAGNNGKTSIRDKFLRRHPRYQHLTESKIQIPVLSIEGTEAEEKRFYKRLLEAANWPFANRPDPEALRNQTLRMLLELGVKMILIDEFHSIAMSPHSYQRRFLAQLKTFSNDMRIPIVAFGTESAANVLRAYDELDHRFWNIALPEWTVSPGNTGGPFEMLLGSFEGVPGLGARPKLRRFKSEIFEKALLDKHQHGATIGDVWEVVEALFMEMRRRGDNEITKTLVSEIEVKHKRIAANGSKPPRPRWQAQERQKWAKTNGATKSIDENDPQG